MRFKLPALIVALCGVLAACSGTEASPDPKPKLSRTERMKRAELASQQPPKVTRHRLENGELLVLDVPVVAAPGYLEGTKCFIWRDTEFRTSSITCPSEPEAPVTPVDLTVEREFHP